VYFIKGAGGSAFITPFFHTICQKEQHQKILLTFVEENPHLLTNHRNTS
jgi:hypothetical protein